MTDYAAVIREKYPSALELARAAGIADPAGPASPGALWLLRVRDQYEWERILGADYPSDEIGFDALETSRAAQWVIFAELKLWQYDSELAYNTMAEFPTEFYATEKARGIRVSEIPGLACTLLEEIANRLGGIMLQELLSLQGR